VFGLFDSGSDTRRASRWTCHFGTWQMTNLGVVRESKVRTSSSIKHIAASLVQVDVGIVWRRCFVIVEMPFIHTQTLESPFIFHESSSFSSIFFFMSYLIGTIPRSHLCL
jgi:hypothetical protein